MATLRSPDGCPWDIEQTHKTLRPYLLEETYEVLEAIDNEDTNHIKEELGDLLLQVVFHAQIADDNNNFTIHDVIDGINDKLERRHPHVFGDVIIKTAEEQTAHWEKIKQKEGKKSAIDGVPPALPSLTRAARIQQKAAAVGFDWPDIAPVIDKVKEEVDELNEASISGDRHAIEEEFGDLLFSLVNYARFLKIDPEGSLQKASNKFSKRFREIEKRMKNDNKAMQSSTLEEMDQYWDQVKKAHHLDPD
ncbi:nucleoside triphosphate pyrophosphohydrolase [bacterium]|nr:nucleoside triphosphate pyrophosphohydrolase [bacterium]